jgi:MYXO-CTERM domain-containing protein
VYHELDLIGPDGQDEALAQENSDIVGNVLIKKSEWRIARIGGDGTGNTAGRYRFVNNTMILSETSETAIGLQETVESLELHNNVVIRIGPAGARLVNHSEPSGPEPMYVGSHNWIADGIGDIPAGFTDTLVGADPGFIDLAGLDLRPQEGAPIVDAGTDMTLTAGAAVPDALAAPTHVPPARALAEPSERPADAALDIGAYELNTGVPPGPGDETGGDSDSPTTGDASGSDSDAPTTGDEAGSDSDAGTSETAGSGDDPDTSAGEVDSADADGTTGSDPAAEGDDSGCGCRSGSGTTAPLALLVLGLLRRRRPR